MALAGLTPSLAAAADPSLDFEPDEPLGPQQWDAVHERLTDGSLRTPARRRARERRDLLLDYLAQEQVTTGGRVAFVDVGWTGRASRALEDVLLDAGRPLPAEHVFVGLKDEAPSVMGPELYGRSSGWLMDEAAGRRLSLRPGEDPVMLIESFAMGSEGSTESYVRDGDRVAPQLASTDNPATTVWDFAGYRRAIAIGLDSYLTRGPVTGTDPRPMIVDRLLAFWRNPSPDEARVFGAQPYGDDFANARTFPLAAPISVNRLVARAVPRLARVAHPIYWRAGAIALTPRPWRFVVRRPTTWTRDAPLRASAGLIKTHTSATHREGVR